MRSTIPRFVLALILFAAAVPIVARADAKPDDAVPQWQTLLPNPYEALVLAGTCRDGAWLTAHIEGLPACTGEIKSPVDVRLGEGMKLRALTEGRPIESKELSRLRTGRTVQLLALRHLTATPGQPVVVWARVRVRVHALHARISPAMAKLRARLAKRWRNAEIYALPLHFGANIDICRTSDCTATWLGRPSDTVRTQL